MLSSGGTTKRLDRLETAGLVERLPDPRYAGDVPKLLDITAVPFRTEHGVVANKIAEAGAIYRLLLRETKPPVREWKLMTPAGFRKRFGDLPPGVDAGQPQLLLVVVTNNDRFTLELSRTSDGTFQVTGLYR